MASARVAAPRSWYFCASAVTASRLPATPVANAMPGKAPRLEAHALPQADDGVEHGTGRPAERSAVERDGLRRGSAAAQESRAARLPLGGRLCTALDAEHVERPRARLGRRSWPAAADDGRARRQVLGLDEQLAERRMGEVVLGPPEHDLGVARDLDLPRPIAGVGHRQAANLDVVLDRDHHLEHGLDPVVGPLEDGLLERERREIRLGLVARRLVRRRPEEAGPDVAEIEELAAGVGGAVLAPAGDRQIAPAARAPAGVGHDRDEGAVREELGMRIVGVRRPEAAERGRRDRPRLPRGLGRARRSRRRLARHPLLQQELGGLHARIRVEARDHHVVQERIGQRDEHHALVVRHVGPDDHARDRPMARPSPRRTRASAAACSRWRRSSRTAPRPRRSSGGRSWRAPRPDRSESPAPWRRAR